MTFLRLSKFPDFRPEIAVAAVLIYATKTKAELAGRIMICRYESAKMAGYAFGSNPPGLRAADVVRPAATGCVKP
jgi:hypothetical protein